MVKNFKTWFVVVAGLALLSLTAIADVTPEKKDGKSPEKPTWLAFMGYQGGFTPPQYHALNQAPYILVFSDGRIIWRDDKAKYEGKGVNPEIWREGLVKKETWKTFIEKARETNFLTVQKEPPKPPVPDANGVISLRPVVSDAATTYLGLNLDGKPRVVAEYALGFLTEEDKEDKYLKSLIAFQKLVESLKPAESKRYEPEAIKVMLFQAFMVLKADEVVPVWPVQNTPRPGPIAYQYSGEDMKKILAVLADSKRVTVDGKSYNAVWAPAFDLPEPESNKPKPPAKPAGSSKNQ